MTNQDGQDGLQMRLLRMDHVVRPPTEKEDAGGTHSKDKVFQHRPSFYADLDERRGTHADFLEDCPRTIRTNHPGRVTTCRKSTEKVRKEHADASHPPKGVGGCEHDSHRTHTSLTAATTRAAAASKPSVEATRAARLRTASRSHRRTSSSAFA